MQFYTTLLLTWAMTCICLVKTLIAGANETAISLHGISLTTNNSISCHYCSTATDENCDDTFDAESQRMVQKCNNSEFCFKTRWFYHSLSFYERVESTPLVNVFTIHQILTDCNFYRATHSAKRGIVIVSRPFVRPSVCP